MRKIFGSEEFLIYVRKNIFIFLSLQLPSTLCLDYLQFLFFLTFPSDALLPCFYLPSSCTWENDSENWRLLRNLALPIGHNTFIHHLLRYLPSCSPNPRQNCPALSYLKCDSFWVTQPANLLVHDKYKNRK